MSANTVLSTRFVGFLRLFESKFGSPTQLIRSTEFGSTHATLHLKPSAKVVYAFQDCRLENHDFRPDSAYQETLKASGLSKQKAHCGDFPSDRVFYDRPSRGNGRFLHVFSCQKVLKHFDSGV